MAFNEQQKKEVREKSAYKCCLCEQFCISLHIHHIIPQEEKGPDTIDNAAPLCPTCHDSYGSNPDKRKIIKERRDWWYKIVEKKYNNPSFDIPILTDIYLKVINLEESQNENNNVLNDLKLKLFEYNENVFDFINKSNDHIENNDIKKINETIIDVMTSSSSSYGSSIIINSTTNLINDWCVKEK